ncbi:hypothetical protein [Pleomorphomonas carboxyditropha]|uniref:hypothetical protein n=1 Tax=Pleomorphomonas carboxyditropha TaxID=2023338 RepID=UPI001056AE95|nr:hypothetical protein [Pleomorphomonas carboxyditropha]
MKIAPWVVRKSLFAFFYGLDAPCAPTKGDNNGKWSMSMARGTERKDKHGPPPVDRIVSAPPALFAQDQNGSNPNPKKVLGHS